MLVVVAVGDGTRRVPAPHTVRGRPFSKRDRPHRIRLAPHSAAVIASEASYERQQLTARHAIGPSVTAAHYGGDERGKRPRQHCKDELAQIAQAQPRVAQRGRSGNRHR
jgi:hypothetical protein